MQAYHQQMANLNLPSGSAGLLIASPSQFANMPQQYHHQPSNYQELVKAYLPQLNGISAGSLSSSPASSSPSSSLSSSSSTTSSLASFAVRLMSLNARELNCLNSDSEFMRIIQEAQAMIDRLNDANSSKPVANQTNQNKQHKLSSNQLNLNLALLQQQQEQQQIHLQQQQHILMSPDHYYQNYYAQQMAYNQMAQFQHQHQQLLSIDPKLNYGNNKQSEPHNDPRINVAQQLNNLNTLASMSVQSSDKQGNNLSQQQLSMPALDLRTTPTRPVSGTPSPTSVRNRSGSTGSVKNSRQLSQQQNFKRAKLSDYRSKQQQSSSGIAQEQAQAAVQEQQHSNHNPNQYDTASPLKTPSTLLVSNENFHEQGAESKRLQQSSPLSNKRVKQEKTESSQDSVASNIASTRSSRLQESKPNINGTNNMPLPTAKKHKGEFDEPDADEVTERQRQLIRPDHYHDQAITLGNCACIIGSEFPAKTPREALEQLDQWRSLEIEQRTKWKWDLNDLPKDIPLQNIKKFEDLRRDFSNGRADFGGASKRKPLGIRGTRQFLLMLYCLWGHPGRDDQMQQDGYCPHCFAKIRTENEQSTLVRVVNHFNMKHRRGANPRLSPETRAATTTPQDLLICETLKSVVETAVASTES